MKSCRARSSALGAALLLCAGAARGQGRPPLSDETVFSAMGAELARSMSKLKQDSFGPPYFMAYRVVDQRRHSVTAYFGSATQESADETRSLYVEVRFGDRSLDNTDLGFQGAYGSAAASSTTLRQSLWALTDTAYKHAVAGYLEKKAKRATELVTEPLDDFTIEPATSSLAPQPLPAFDPGRARSLVESLSAVFRGFPKVFDAGASVSERWSRRFLLTSEGTRVANASDRLPGALHMSVTTRAKDGMRLDNYRSWRFRDLANLPPEKELRAAAVQLARELMEEREAPVQSPTAGPAILDAELTGILFHEALGHKLEGQRQRDPQQSQLFKDLIGKPIIPDFLSFVDDPTLKEYGGEPLNGSYDIDSEGVPARPVALVERGVLKNFLMSRWPVKGFTRSNGHGRADAFLRPTGRMANLIVRAEAPVPRAELTRRLMALARKAGKPYGFLLVGAFGGENPTSRDSAQTLEARPRLIYRVDAKTGALTMVRGVSLVGTPLVILNRIVAAGDDPRLANGFTCGAESGYVPVSQIAPSVLLSEIEVQRLPEDRNRPPILESPFHDGRP